MQHLIQLPFVDPNDRETEKTLEREWILDDLDSTPTFHSIF